MKVKGGNVESKMCVKIRAVTSSTHDQPTSSATSTTSCDLHQAPEDHSIFSSNTGIQTVWWGAHVSASRTPRPLSLTPKNRVLCWSRISPSCTTFDILQCSIALQTGGSKCFHISATCLCFLVVSSHVRCTLGRAYSLY